MENKKIICPSCGSNDIKQFVYGYIAVTRDKQAEFDRRYILGGCDLSPKNPTHHCFGCGEDWRDNI